MNPLLLRRRGMMQAGGGTPLPYDSKIEYLQRLNTTSAYIDTGIVPTNTHGIYLYVEPLSTADVYICGLRKDSGNTRWCIGYFGGSSNAYFGWGSLNTNLNNTFTKGELALNFQNSRHFTVKQEGGVELTSSTLSTLSFSTTLTIFLFGYNRYGSVNPTSQKLYACKISNGSTIILDLIPVRIGTVGYMYDRVSGQLFGNSGTDSFVLGPDVQ